MFRPDPPQGFSTEQEQVIIGRPPIPLFGVPQGIGVAPPIGDSALVQTTTLSALVQTGTLSALVQTEV